MHPLLVAETFVDPSRFRGTCYRAANWTKLGLSKGYARSNGKFTDKHGQKKVLLAYPLQAGARELPAQAGDRPEWHCKAVRVRYANEELRSLRSLPDEVEDGRGRHGKRHSPGAVLALQLLSRMAGCRGGRAAETFCQTLSQEELRAPGCRWSPVSRRCETPSDTTFQRVMADTGPASLERVAQRWTQPRTREAKVLAADGKRMRGANRLSPEGLHWETVTLVDPATGVPVASRSDREECGEQQALRDLLEEVGLRGRVITLDAGHAGKEIQEGIVKQHGGDVVVTLKGNCPETYATLRGLSRAGSEYRARARRGVVALDLRVHAAARAAGLPVRAAGLAPAARDAQRAGDGDACLRRHVAAAEAGVGGGPAGDAAAALGGGERQPLPLRRDAGRGPQPHPHGARPGRQRGPEQPRAGLDPEQGGNRPARGADHAGAEPLRGGGAPAPPRLAARGALPRRPVAMAPSGTLRPEAPPLPPEASAPVPAALLRTASCPSFRRAGLSGNLTGSRNTGSTIDSPKKNRPWLQEGDSSCARSETGADYVPI